MHTIIGYLLLINGDASLARSGWLAMIRAENEGKCWNVVASLGDPTMGPGSGEKSTVSCGF